jgi:hypothetical protein
MPIVALAHRDAVFCSKPNHKSLIGAQLRTRRQDNSGLQNSLLVARCLRSNPRFDPSLETLQILIAAA